MEPNTEGYLQMASSPGPVSSHCKRFTAGVEKVDSLEANTPPSFEDQRPPWRRRPSLRGREARKLGFQVGRQELQRFLGPWPQVTGKQGQLYHGALPSRPPGGRAVTQHY